MRSHPYTPPPPLPPIIDDIATVILPMIPNQTTPRSYPSAGGGGHHRNSSGYSLDDMDIPLSGLDPDTSRLLPRRRQRQLVRVQGRLAMVRSVSTANLRSPTSTTGNVPNMPAMPSPTTNGGGGSVTSPRGADAAVGSFISSSPRRGGRRRRSHDGITGKDSTSEDSEEDVAALGVRDRQLRGYGIGGVGNIRRPTEVIGGGASSRRQSIFFSSSSLSTSTPSTPPPLPTSPGKKSGSKWTLFDILGRMGDRKGKLRVKA